MRLISKTKPKARPLETQRVVGDGSLSRAIYSIFPCMKPKHKEVCKRLERKKINVNEGFRNAFNTSFVYHTAKNGNASHSHSRAALDRKLAESSVRGFIVGQGFQPYSVSPSSRDFSAGTDAQRYFYSPKDLDQPYTDVRITKDHILYMIDVDYYADMHRWLLKGRPIILYTMVPRTTGGPTTDGSFYFANNKLVLTVNGGGRYEHELWDYGLDHFVITDKKTNWSLMVKVDQVVSPLDEDRRIVCLTPTTWYPARYNKECFKTVNTLSRKKIQVGDVNIMTVQTIDKVTRETLVEVSCSYVGAPSAIKVRYDLFYGLCLRLSQDKHPSVATVERYLNTDKIKDAGILAPVIFEAFTNGWFKTPYADVSKLQHAGTAKVVAPHFQCLGPLLNEEGKEIGVVVEQPVVLGAAVFPKLSYNNDNQAVEGRVNAVRNDKPPTLKLRRHAEAFIKAFPKATLHPVSESEVIEEQTRPLQKVRNEQNKNWLRENFVVKAFMKKESYPKVTDPRNISSCTPSHTVRLSRFTYAAKEHFKFYKWYMPGHNPEEICEAIRDFVSDVNSVNETDYSRLDGTISEFLRSVEKGVYLRLFDSIHHSELAKLLEDEYRCKAFTASGTKYQPGFSRLSGSPLTTDGNTIICAFILYVAAVEAKIINEGDIEKIPGLLYSDDGLSKRIPPALLVQTAKDLGMTLKMEVRKRGEPLTFLARVFVDPWTTSTSLQDPLRCLGKIHLSSVKHIEPKIVAVHKATGLQVTDPLTPVISEYCTHVLRKYPEVTREVLKKYDFSGDVNWWVDNFERSWPQSQTDVPLMEKHVAAALKLSESELVEFRADIRKGKWVPLDRTLPTTVTAQLTTEYGDTMLIAPSTSPTSVASLPARLSRRGQVKRRDRKRSV